MCCQEQTERDVSTFPGEAGRDFWGNLKTPENEKHFKWPYRTAAARKTNKQTNIWTKNEHFFAELHNKQKEVFQLQH